MDKVCKCAYCELLFRPTGSHPAQQKYCSPECSRFTHYKLAYRKSAKANEYSRCLIDRASPEETAQRMETAGDASDERFEARRLQYAAARREGLTPAEREQQEYLARCLDIQLHPPVIVLPPDVPKTTGGNKTEYPLPKSISGWPLREITKWMQLCGYGLRSLLRGGCRKRRMIYVR